METLLEESLDFIQQTDWIHCFQVTKIFDGPLQKIPKEWIKPLAQLSTEELNHLPFIGNLSSEKYPDWPQSLHSFLEIASRLSLDRQQAVLTPTPVGPAMARGMNPKKLHEVSYIATLVNDIVCKTGCNFVVDVGSGLGYLDHVLHQAYCHPVLGLEVSNSHVSRAESRAAAQGLRCGGVKSISFNLTNNAVCFEQFEMLLSRLGSSLNCTCIPTKCASSSSEKVLANQSQNLRVCLIGLHCCGDLSPTMMAMFHAVPSIQALCYVSCCYHKMTFSSLGVCSNVPLSAACKKKYDSLQRDASPWVIQAPMLRLGAQETRSRWKKQSNEDHSNHVRHVAYRGLLELVDCIEPALKRTLVRKCDFSSFETFLDTLFSSKLSNGLPQKWRSALHDLYHKHEKSFHLIEPLTALQTILQPVVETLIYRDRLCWLTECGYTKVQIVPVFEEAISPRNLAVVAVK